VLGVLPGLVALVQATEVVKLVTGIGEPLVGRLLLIDALRMEFHQFRLHKDPDCALCGEHPSVTGLVDYEGFCGVPALAAEADAVPEITATELAARRAEGRELLLLDVREPEEFATARIEGARLIPLAALEARQGELAAWKTRPVVVHCHRGGRSARAGRYLRERGFERVENLAGGIEAWSVTVDPEVPRY
jgi:adenylyltransferase/sulfurtransferase